VKVRQFITSVQFGRCIAAATAFRVQMLILVSEAGKINLADGMKYSGLVGKSKIVTIKK
jgi:hypothetical protein